MNAERDFFDFIELHLKNDPYKLRLNEKRDSYNFNLENAIMQIECRQKYNRKLKNFIKCQNFIFPDYLSGEQASHQAVAIYHASLVGKNKNILDMTSGLGIDSLTFAKAGNKVLSFDIDENKVKTLTKNAKELNIETIETVNQDSIEFLKDSNCKFDLIFIDPSRRNHELKRIYNLNDCLPNVIENQDLILSHTDKLLIKASPMLDVNLTIKDFPDITSLRAIGVNGECKEILIEIDNSSEKSKGEISLEAVNLNNEGEILSHFLINYNNIGKETEKKINYLSSQEIIEGQFLLEPSAMLMKLAPWNYICEKFNAFKLDSSSQLFITKIVPVDFPGRVTRIQKIINKKDRKSLIGFPASVVSRNYPLSSDEIRKKYKLKEGDENFIYATRVNNTPVLLLTNSKTITC